MKQAIIIFSRIPSLGGSKTRLQNLLSQQKIQNVSLYLLSQTIECCRQVDADLKLFVTPYDEKDIILNELDLTNIELAPQEGESIGDRMLNAIQSVLNRGYERVVLIGSDLYDLSAELLEQGLKDLITHNIAIAPTLDGGYGLIGMREALPAVFDLQAYSHQYVYQQVIDICKKNNLSVSILPQIRDIDTREDIVRIITDDPQAHFFTQGEYNANFTFGDSQKLLRIALESQLHLENQIDYEYHTLKVLEESGVTPKVYQLVPYHPLLDSGYLVEEFLPGQPLNYEEDLDKAATILAKVHSVDPAKADHLIVASHPFQVMMDEFETMFTVYQASDHRDTAIQERIEHLLELLKQTYNLAEGIKHPTIINTELNSHNFLINEEGASYLIDWEKPLIGDREQDLAHFLAPTTTLWRTDYLVNNEEIDSFITSYNRVAERPVDVERLDQYLLFTCLRGVTWCAMAYIQYLDSGKDQQFPESFAVIESFLQDDFITMIESYFRERGLDPHG